VTGLKIEIVIIAKIWGGGVVSLIRTLMVAYKNKNQECLSEVNLNCSHRKHQKQGKTFFAIITFLTLR